MCLELGVRAGNVERCLEFLEFRLGVNVVKVLHQDVILYATNESGPGLAKE